MASADFSSSTYASPAPQSTLMSGAGTVLQKNLAQLTSRRNALVLWHAIAGALSWGLGAAALLVLAYRFYLVEYPLLITVVPLALSIVIGARLGLLAKRNTLATALEADEKLG